MAVLYCFIETESGPQIVWQNDIFNDFTLYFIRTRDLLFYFVEFIYSLVFFVKTLYYALFIELQIFIRFYLLLRFNPESVWSILCHQHTNKSDIWRKSQQLNVFK